MVRGKIVLSVLIIACLHLFAGCEGEKSLEGVFENYFIKYLGSEGSQLGVDMVVNEPEGTVMLLGTHIPPNATTESRAILVKADWNGNVIWKRILSGPSDVPVDLEPLPGGGFILLTETRDNPAAPDDQSLNLKLVRLTSEGSRIDSVVFATPMKDGVYANEYPETVTAVADGFVVTGSTEYDTEWALGGLNNVVDAMRIKFDLNLQITTDLDLTTSNSQNDFGYKTVELSTGKLYTFGSSFKAINSPINDNFNFWVVPDAGEDYDIGIRSTGNDEKVTAICESDGSGYFLVGTHESPGNHKIYMGLVYEDNGLLKKAPFEGILDIPQHTNDMLIPTAVSRTVAGPSGYLILANEGDVGFRNIWLSKVSNTNPNQVFWSARFGSPDRNDDTSAAVAELPDGRILVLGTMNFGSDNYKMALIKLNSGGRLEN